MGVREKHTKEDFEKTPKNREICPKVYKEWNEKRGKSKSSKDVRQKGLSEAIAMLRIFSRRKASNRKAFMLF